MMLLCDALLHWPASGRRPLERKLPAEPEGVAGVATRMSFKVVLMFGLGPPRMRLCSLSMVAKANVTQTSSGLLRHFLCLLVALGNSLEVWRHESIEFCEFGCFRPVPCTVGLGQHRVG